MPFLTSFCVLGTDEWHMENIFLKAVFSSIHSLCNYFTFVIYLAHILVGISHILYFSQFDVKFYISTLIKLFRPTLPFLPIWLSYALCVSVFLKTSILQWYLSNRVTWQFWNLTQKHKYIFAICKDIKKNKKCCWCNYVTKYTE